MSSRKPLCLCLFACVTLLGLTTWVRGTQGASLDESQLRNICGGQTGQGSDQCAISGPCAGATGCLGPDINGICVECRGAAYLRCVISKEQNYTQYCVETFNNPQSTCGILYAGPGIPPGPVCNILNPPQTACTTAGAACAEIKPDSVSANRKRDFCQNGEKP